jgi:hypothetical protein
MKIKTKKQYASDLFSLFHDAIKRKCFYCNIESKVFTNSDNTPWCFDCFLKSETIKNLYRDYCKGNNISEDDLNTKEDKRINRKMYSDWCGIAEKVKMKNISFSENIYLFLITIFLIASAFNVSTAFFILLASVFCKFIEIFALNKSIDDLVHYSEKYYIDRIDSFKNKKGFFYFFSYSLMFVSNALFFTGMIVLGFSL